MISRVGQPTITTEVRDFSADTSKNNAKPKSQDTIETKPAEQEASYWSQIVSWFWGIFSSPKEASKTAPDSDSLTIDPTQIGHKPRLERPENDMIRKINQHLSETSHRTKEITDDICDEIGLEREWVAAQIRQINIRKDASHLDDEEMIRLQGAIKNIREKIDQVLQEKLNKGTTGKILGMIGWGNAAICLATFIVVAGLTVSIGTGNIPGVILMLQGAASVVGGAVQFAESINKKQRNDLESAIFGSRDDRRNALDKLTATSEDKMSQTDAVLQTYRDLKEVESNRFEAIRDVS